MNRHLTPEQFVDALEQPLPADRQAHLAVCANCANELAEMRLLMGDVTLAGTVPEPSPLFWNHLSARVLEAVDAEPVPVTPWWGGWRSVATLVGVVGVVALAVVLRPSLTQAPTVADTAAVAATEAAVVAAAESDEMWSLIALVSPSMPADKIFEAGLQPNPAATEAAIESLTNAQRQELVKLLRAEMGVMGEHE